jgi:hypothetical protein
MLTMLVRTGRRIDVSESFTRVHLQNQTTNINPTKLFGLLGSRPEPSVHGAAGAISWPAGGGPAVAIARGSRHLMPGPNGVGGTA